MIKSVLLTPVSTVILSILTVAFVLVDRLVVRKFTTNRVLARLILPALSVAVA